MINTYNATIPPLLFSWEGEMIIKSESNMREHFWKVKKRRDHQKSIIYYAMYDVVFDNNHPLNTLILTETLPPCFIILTRLYPRLLDDDNNVGAFKFVRDEISNILIPGKANGRADSDPRLKWEYKQEKSKLKGCRIEIFKT